MERSFNCLLLGKNDIFPISIYKDDIGKFVTFDPQKIYLDRLTVVLLRDYIRRKENIAYSDNIKLWKVNDIRSIKDQDISTEDIVQKLQGKEMELQELFGEYFRGELDGTVEFKVTNIHIIVTINPATTGKCLVPMFYLSN